MIAHVRLKGELFKAGETNTAFKLRWFELLSDGQLIWHDQVGTPPKGQLSLRDAIIGFEPPIEKPSKSDGDGRFGLRITPASGARNYVLRAVSEEERRVWAEAMDAASHPVGAYRFGGTGRIVTMKKPTSGRLGIDLSSRAGSPCVTVVGIDPAAMQEMQHRLLVGDVIVAVDSTVLRTQQIAEMAFGRVQLGSLMTIRLASWNREIRMIKQGGVSGVTLCAPAAGAGVLVQSVAPHSAAATAGLNVGDRVLAINSVHCGNDHEQASDKIRQALQEVKMVVCGVSVAINLRKDTNGYIGLGFVTTGRQEQGAVISDVTPRSAAALAGVRNGDLLLSIDGELVTDAQAAFEILQRAPRAVGLVVWRARPDPDPSEQNTATGMPVANSDEESAFVGAVPWTYYSFNLAADGTSPEMLPPTLPFGVPLYEDMTVGDRI